MRIVSVSMEVTTYSKLLLHLLESIIETASNLSTFHFILFSYPAIVAYFHGLQLSLYLHGLQLLSFYFHGLQLLLLFMACKCRFIFTACSCRFIFMACNWFSQMQALFTYISDLNILFLKIWCEEQHEILKQYFHRFGQLNCELMF